jgi:hypothetical protein
VVMQDAISTLLLVCASLASLALGVLLAYSLCRTGFALLRMHARAVALEAAGVETQPEPQAAQAS